MLTILFCMLVVFVYVLKGDYGNKESWNRWGLVFYLQYGRSRLWRLLVLAFVAGVLLAILFGSYFPKHWIHSRQARVLDLRISDGSQGDFLLGIGDIRSSLYIYFIKNEADGYQPVKILVDKNVTIREMETAESWVLEYELDFENPIHGWLGFAPPLKRYEFHIPQGMLKKSWIK